MFCQLNDPGFGLLHPLLVLKGKGFGHHRHRERPDLLGHLGADGRPARPGAAPHPRRDEDHMRAGQHVPDLVPVLFRGPSADVGVGACAEPLGELYAELELQGGLRGREGLGIGVGADKVDPHQAHLDHVVHGVAAAPADADDLDLRAAKIILDKLEHIHDQALRD